MSQIYTVEIAEQTANQLLDIGAVKLRPDEPYTWASGWKSPIYCDNRKVQSYPAVRNSFAMHMAQLIQAKFPEVQIIASVATGAITHGVLAADRANLPHVYINKKPKDHGVPKLVDGDFTPGQKVVVVEDLFSTGSSSLKAVQAAQNEGLDVIGMAGIMTYNFPQVAQTFANEKFDIVTMTNYDFLLQAALKRGAIQEDQQQMLTQWRQDPANWTGPVLKK